MNLFCYVSKLLFKTKAERNGMQSPGGRQIKSLFSLLPPTLPSIFLDSHLGLSLSLQGSTLDVIEAYKHVQVVEIS